MDVPEPLNANHIFGGYSHRVLQNSYELLPAEKILSNMVAFVDLHPKATNCYFLELQPFGIQSSSLVNELETPVKGTVVPLPPKVVPFFC